ncbi:MAG TPA: sugar ABC transporter permease [Ktedonobacterales bacterium]|nr:sugar ABC transporter permease [Ktedonobacterales bacterium]
MGSTLPIKKPLPSLSSLNKPPGLSRFIPQRLRRYLPIYALILPGYLLFLIWTLYPLLDAFVMSFTEWNPNPSGTSPFVGVDNYTRALHDPVFFQSFGNVTLYTIVTVAGQIVFGLGVALLLNRKMAARGVFRALYYIPVISSWVVVSLIFSYLFSSQGGLVNYIFGNVLHLISPDQNWLGDLHLALPTLMILGIWKGVGWNMVAFLAALQGIPTELYESAQTEGANAWAQFRYITLPLLRPVITFVSVVLTIGGLGSFIQIFIITGGGPLHTTETLLTYAYNNAFSTFDFGYAAALTYIFAAVVFVFALIQIGLSRRQAA